MHAAKYTYLLVIKSSLKLKWGVNISIRHSKILLCKKKFGNKILTLRNLCFFQKHAYLDQKMGGNLGAKINTKRTWYL